MTLSNDHFLRYCKLMKNTLIKCSVASCSKRVSRGAVLAFMLATPAMLIAAPPQTSVEERLQRIERIIENPVLLQLSRRLGEQQREIQELQDQIDYLKRDLRNAQRAVDKRYKETDDRLSVLEKAQEEAKVKADEASNFLALPSTTAPKQSLEENEEEEKKNIEPTMIEGPAESPIETHPASKQEMAAYQHGFELIKRAEYDASIQVFQDFLINSPQSELASNASYWMGEAYYIKEDNQQALKAFNRVIEVYPMSSKVPDAMLRAADCLANLGQEDEAKNMYSELVERYPQTPAAEKAFKRLESLQ